MNNNINDNYKQQVYIEDTFDFTEGQKMSPSRYKRYKRERVVYNLISFIIIAASIAILFQAYSIGRHFYISYKNNKQAQLAQNIFDETIVQQTFITPAPVVQSLDIPEISIPKREDIKKEIRPEILTLRREFNNDDVIGYIIIDDTNIRYPVLQTDNNEFYLTHDVLKNKNTSGAIFLDGSNSLELTDKNSVIYGNNMRNKTMFYDLQNYIDTDYLKAHPQISVVTPYDETVWEVFSAYRASTSFNYKQTAFDDNSPYLPFLSVIYEKSFVDTGVKVDKDDIVLTLSTGSNTEDDMLYIVHAKLIERK